MQKYTYTVVSVGPPKASGPATVRVEQRKAYTPHGATMHLMGRHMTQDELKAREGK